MKIFYFDNGIYGDNYTNELINKKIIKKLYDNYYIMNPLLECCTNDERNILGELEKFEYYQLYDNMYNFLDDLPYSPEIYVTDGINECGSKLSNIINPIDISAIEDEFKFDIYNDKNCWDKMCEIINNLGREYLKTILQNMINDIKYAKFNFDI